jgi:hypothetical protein
MNTQGIEPNGMKISETKLYSFNSLKKQDKKAVKNDNDKFESHKDLNIGKYNASGKVEAPIASKYDLILAIKSQIDDQVKQITEYYNKIFNQSQEGKKAKESLKEYFEENPEDLEKIEAGEVPEYWNKENTAKRIFDIAVQSYQKDISREDFYENSSKMVKQAYAEVEKMVGNLPDLVNETKDAVLKGLEEFRDGKAVSEISFS